MQPKPAFLGPQAASAFRDPSVVDAYRYRPTYPAAAIEILAELIVDSPRAVLDVGCGTGYLARQLVNHAGRVDALDISRPMIEHGRGLPGGDHPNLRWMVGSAEDEAVHPPYALITAGDSLHWMEWSIVMPRFASMLTSHGCLAILGVEQLPAPWDTELWPIRRRYSVIPNFQYFDLIRGLEERRLFRRIGKRRTEPMQVAQSLDDYIESFHGRAAFSRERMTHHDAAAFDDEMRRLISRFCADTVEIRIVTEVVWGRPLETS